MDFTSLLRWFTGGADHAYMTLAHCMAHDRLWITITIVLDLAVASGYLWIARHWWQNQRLLKNVRAKAALGRMRNIFIFCGLCGYLFIPIKMVWPAWRLYDMFLVVLVYFTWRYALGARDLKVIYHELNRSEALALELDSSREEARRKSFFLNAIGHDLRNPLYGISLCTDMARDQIRSGNTAAIEESIGLIQSAAGEMRTLIESFLELGRLDNGSVPPIKPAPVELRPLLESVAAQQLTRARLKGLRIEVDAPADLHIVTDREKIERVLTNLADNAITHTEQGEITLRAKPAGACIELSVQDTGPGIAPEHVDRIFEEFYQVNNDERERSKGFGLGLAIVSRLVDHLGGRIDVRSEPGRGCCFTVHLPEDNLPLPAGHPGCREFIAAG